MFQLLNTTGNAGAPARSGRIVSRQDPEAFEVSDCSVSPQNVSGGDQITVEVTVTNTSDAAPMRPTFAVRANGEPWQSFLGVGHQPGDTITYERDFFVQSRFGDTQDIEVFITDVEIVGGL